MVTRGGVPIAAACYDRGAMNIHLSTKLFIAVMALCTFAVGGMGVATYLNFNQNFLGYLNEQAVERLDALVPRFEHAYTGHGSWAFLLPRDATPPDSWFQLLRPEPPTANGEVPQQRGIPPVSDLTGAFLRLTLFDGQMHYVFGYRQYDAQQVLRPIQVDGQTVGWLGMTLFESVSATGDQRFQSSQVRASLLIGLACVLICAIIIWWIARVLLRPVREVARATHRLAEGDYSTRVPVVSRDEAGQLADDFNRMAEKLASTEQLRRDFMADISHELRTPLAILRAELEALEDGIRAMDATSVRSLQAEVLSLTRLVDDLFELSLAEVGGPTYRREAVELGDLLDTAADTYRPRFTERGLQFTLEQVSRGLTVTGDSRRLTQLLYNLFENSLRYTDPGGEVRVRARAEKAWVVIDVFDSAPDVPVGLHEQLFQRFYRVDTSRSRRSGGAGLGLAICRGIAQTHGGTLQAQPSPLGGLWLVLSLPRREGV